MRLTPLPCLFTLLTPVLFCSCLATPSRAPVVVRLASIRTPEKGERLQHIVQQLTAGRARFLATGDLNEVFSVFYCHTTMAILERVKNGTVREPDLILEMMENFYGDYARNRSPALREPHWQPYYTLAATAPSPDFKTGRELIQRGTEAHLDHDLRPLLTHLLQRHPELRGARLAALEVALESLNDLFLPASVRGFQDLAKVLPHAPGPRGIVFQSLIARAIITRKRQRAWNGAVRELR